MRFYTVFEPPRGRSTEARNLETAFVRDGWSWGAFLVAPVWLAWRRMWLPLAVYLMGSLALALLLDLWAPGDWIGFVIGFAIALLLGLEGNALRAASLRAKGWNETASVSGASRVDAEHDYFADRLARQAPAGAPTAPGPA